jgi:hypothetical protein
MLLGKLLDGQAGSLVLLNPLLPDGAERLLGHVKSSEKIRGSVWSAMRLEGRG